MELALRGCMQTLLSFAPMALAPLISPKSCCKQQESTWLPYLGTRAREEENQKNEEPCLVAAASSGNGVDK